MKKLVSFKIPKFPKNASIQPQGLYSNHGLTPNLKGPVLEPEILKYCEPEPEPKLLF